MVPERRFEAMVALRQEIDVCAEPWGNQLDRAVELCDWPAVVHLVERNDPHLEHARTAYAYTYALWLQGDAWEALSTLRHSQLRHPRDTRLPSLFDAVRQSIDTNAKAFVDIEAISNDTLSLDPLGPQHLDDFALQYYDPEIARLCCLPVFRSAEEWLDWLAYESAFGNQFLFAILHENYGFVGSVAIVLHERSSLVYYWVGADFRGERIAGEALSLLLERAAAWGVESSYAKVFHENEASQRTLIRRGFEPLPIVPVPPHHDEALFRRGPVASLDQICAEIRGVLHAAGSRIVIARPCIAVSSDG